MPIYKIIITKEFLIEADNRETAKNEAYKYFETPVNIYSFSISAHQHINQKVKTNLKVFKQ
jgi:hypothetical protein